MKIIVFIVLLIACFVLIPDVWINHIVMPHIQISGDGEEAINSYEFTAIMIKAGISAAVALVLLSLRKFLKRK